MNATKRKNDLLVIAHLHLKTRGRGIVMLLRITIAALLIAGAACEEAVESSPDATNCTWSWRGLGCVPAADCKLKW